VEGEEDALADRRRIVRSDSGAFRKPEILERLIEEEAQAGWVMLEKFDDNRVRFKQSRSTRAGP